MARRTKAQHAEQQYEWALAISTHILDLLWLLTKGHLGVPLLAVLMTFERLVAVAQATDGWRDPSVRILRERLDVLRAQLDSPPSSSPVVPESPTVQ